MERRVLACMVDELAQPLFAVIDELPPRPAIVLREPAGAARCGEHVADPAPSRDLRHDVPAIRAVPSSYNPSAANSSTKASRLSPLPSAITVVASFSAGIGNGVPPRSATPASALVIAARTCR